MGKIFLFYIIWRLVGNPILAVVVILLIYYAIDRRYIGLLPSILKPFRRLRRISNLRNQILLNPHDMPSTYDLAQAYMGRKHYQKALGLLGNLSASMQESADVLYDTGVCHLALGHVEIGENLVLRAITMQSKLRYGEPYLKLATAIAPTNPAKALEYIKEFQNHNFSSCESYYRMGQLYKRFENTDAAKEAWKQCLRTYHALPKFRRRIERRWALLARWRLALP